MGYDFQNGEVLLFDKPLDWTSFDLVQKVRNYLCRSMGIKKLKVGHAGTLDPKATGLMVICTGKATRLIEELQQGEKEYIAELRLGATTPSFDLETEEDSHCPTDHVNNELLKSVLQKFVGEQLQVPPLFSAVKINGKRAYEHARKGRDIKLNAKLINIHGIELTNFSANRAVIRVVCGKGTYIRALARDIGTTLNTGAYLTGLRRTRIGKASIADAMTIESFMQETAM